MRQRVSLVIKLVDIKGAWRFVGKAPGVVLIVGGMAFVNVRAGKLHLRSQRAQMENLLAAHFVRHHQNQAIIFLRGDQRQTEAGIAGGGFDNRAAGF